MLSGEQVDALTAACESLLIGKQADVHTASSCGCGTKHAMLLRYFCCVILARVRRFSSFSIKMTAIRTVRKKRKATRKRTRKTRRKTRKKK